MKMKRFVFFFIILFTICFFFGACGSRKSTLASSFSQIETTEVQLVEQSVIDSSAISNTNINTNEVTQINTDEAEFNININFDTDKPINPTTGLPPIKSINATGKAKKTAENTEKTTETNIETETQFKKWLERFLQSQTKIDTKEKITEKTEKKESQLLKWIAIIVVCGTAIIFFLKSKGILGWIKKLVK